MDHDKETDRQTEQLSAALGWFSIALGVSELATPRTIARAAGLPNSSVPLLRVLGAREIGHGISILTQPDRPTPVWSRVAGDAIDMAVLLSAFGSDRSDRRRVSGAIAALGGVAALDVFCASRLGRDNTSSQRRQEYARNDWMQRGVRVEQATTINRSIDDVYRFWRNFENFPRFMRHLESVQQVSGTTSRWRAKGPAGMSVQWEAEMIEEREHERIAWRSLEGADVPNSGSVRFQRAPGARGTEIRVQLQYSPPAGAFGQRIAWLFGEEPSQQIHEDLHRAKQLLETGEIPLSDGFGLWRAAQPPADPLELKEIAGVQQ
jgi:uncharacterized membrane protein